MYIYIYIYTHTYTRLDKDIQAYNEGGPNRGAIEIPNQCVVSRLVDLFLCAVCLLYACTCSLYVYCARM